jgi:peptidoglycan/LPS O-acetylase OafA/YrhL
MFAPLVFFTAHPATGFWTQEPGPAAYIWRNLFFPRSQIAIGHTLSTNPWGSDWNGSLWTLFYEGASYLLLATAGLMGLLQRRAHWGFGAILLLLVFHALWQSTAHPSAIAWLFDTPGKNLCLLFAAGMAIVLAPGTWKSRLTCKTAGFTAAVLLALAWKLGAGPALSPLLLPPVVLSLSLHPPLSRWESLVGGDYSYGLYLYAYPVAQLLSFFEMQRWGYGPYFFFNLTLALLCALASWHWLERPVLTFKNSHGARHFLIASFICKLKEPGRYIRARNPAGERHQQS